MSFEFLVLSFEFFPTRPFISDFGFADGLRPSRRTIASEWPIGRPPTHPAFPASTTYRCRRRVAARPKFREEGWLQLKTKNSKLKTGEVVS